MFKNGIGVGVSLAEMTSNRWQTRPSATPAEVKPSHPAVHNSPGRSEAASVVPSSVLANILCDPKNYPTTKTACIVRAFAEEMSQDTKTVADPLSRAGFTIRNYGLTSVDEVVALHNGLKDCGVVYVRTHGVMNEDFAYEFSGAEAGAGCDPATPTKNHCGNHLMTQIALTKGTALPTLQALKTKLGRLVRSFGSSPHTSKDGTTQTYLTLAPEFFADVSYSNALVYVDACHSDAPIPTPPGGDQLREAFTQNGAGSFLGWSKAVPESIASAAAQGIFEKLAPKVSNIDSLTLSAPSSQAAGQSYLPTVTIAPAQGGIDISLVVSRTDGRRYGGTKTTDASGLVTFDAIPGGAAGTVDTLTASAGGAADSTMVATVVKNDPALQVDYSLFSDDVSIANLNETSVKDFNLACANAKLTSRGTKVTFSGGSDGGTLPCGAGSPYVNCTPPSNPNIPACVPGQYQCADSQKCYATEQDALDNCAPIWCVRCH